MKSLFTLCLLAISLSASAQTYVSVEAQDTTTIGLAALAFPGRSFPFTSANYKITYNTVGVFGEPTTASGLLAIPTDRSLVYPMAVYNHGTVQNREAVPSRRGVQERLLPSGLAQSGYITVAPDYLGLGDSELAFHPYVHAASEASAGRDLVLAAQQWLDEQGIAYNEQLFLTGYSQGGHATQALHRDLELNPGDDGLTVTAATHLSGPYSISDVMRNTLFTELQTLPGYIAYTYISYDYVYDLFDDFEEIFQPAYLANIEAFANGLRDLGEFDAILTQQLANNGDDLADIFQDSIRRQLATKDLAAPVIQAMLDNDTYDWAPQSPTLIYYCTADEQVPFRNALLADSVMAANGSTAVTVGNGGPRSHGACVFPAITATLEFWDDLAERSTVSTRDAIVDAPEVSIFPNPVRMGERLQLQGLKNQTGHAYQLYDQLGRVTAYGVTTADGSLNVPTKLTPGIHLLRVELGNGTALVRRLVIR